MAGAKKKVDSQEEDKKMAYQKAMDKLNKSYGAGTIIGANEVDLSVDVESTGSIALNAALGAGGFPYGRIIEIIGPESCGKSTLCAHVIANAQKAGKRCLYIDMEHCAHGGYMSSIGINLNDMIISQPMNGEAALEIAHEMAKTGEIDVIIVDSVAALVPKAEVDGTIGDQSVARLGRLMSQACRVLSPILESNNCMLIFTNQIRMNPGAMGGSGEEPPGGKALRFYASVRLDMRRIKNDKNEELSRTKIKVLKNKVGKPFQEIEIDLVWGEGFGKLGEIVDLAEELGIIVLSGSWYKWPGKDAASIAQGRNAVIQLLKDNPEMKEAWEKQIIGMLTGEEEPETAIVTT